MSAQIKDSLPPSIVEELHEASGTFNAMYFGKEPIERFHSVAQYFLDGTPCALVLSDMNSIANS